MGLLDSKKQQSLVSRLPKIGVTDPICPYCNGELRQKPARKTQCPYCKNYIYVRTRPHDQQKVLVTDKQAELIEEQWSIVNGTHDDYLANKRRIEEERNQLTTQFGRIPSEDELKWSLLNKELIKHATNSNWGLYRNTRFQMAELLRNESKLKQAFSMYCWICYLDLNGPQNTGGARELALLRDYPPFSPKEAFLAPGIISRMKRLIKKLNLPEEEVLKIFLETADLDYNALKLPVQPDKAWQDLRKELFA